MGNFNIKRNKDMNLFQASINMKTASEPIRHGKGGISISHQRRRGGGAARGRNASHSFHMSWWKSAEPNALVRAVNPWSSSLQLHRTPPPPPIGFRHRRLSMFAWSPGDHIVALLRDAEEFVRWRRLEDHSYYGADVGGDAYIISDAHRVSLLLVRSFYCARHLFEQSKRLALGKL